jgi:hypothetical protein
MIYCVKNNLLFILLSLLIASCNNSSFSGGSKSGAGEKKPEATTPAKNPDKNPKPGDEDALGESTDKETEEPDLDAEIVGSADIDSEVKPDEIVDGQEVLISCKTCLARAKTLATEVGFTAVMEKTYNLGFYKIEPSRNLCDIHFMSDMKLPIDDHEGQDSKGNGQVILYCPCDCGWASSGPGDLVP